MLRWRNCCPKALSLLRACFLSRSFFSAVTAALEFAVICNKTLSQIFVDTSRNSHCRSWHRQSLICLPTLILCSGSLLPIAHFSDLATHWGQNFCFQTPKYVTNLISQWVVKERTLTRNQKPELIWSFIHSKSIFKHFLCVRYWSKFWKTQTNKTVRSLPSKNLNSFYWRKTINKYMIIEMFTDSGKCHERKKWGNVIDKNCSGYL